MLEHVPCAICGATGLVPVIEKFGLPLSRCPRCGLVSANPRTSKDEIWKRYSSDYFWHEYLPALGVQDGRFDLETFDRRHAATLQLIAAHAGKPGRLLEIGTGAGFFLKAAERAGWSVAGVELSSEGAAFARDRLGLEIRQEAAESLTFPARTFDVAVMFDVIEHLFDPKAVLEAIGRVLKPGGLLLITTPNFDALSRHALGSAWAVLSPLEHVYYFTEATLRELLARSSFSDVRFVRRRRGSSPIETMNYRYTHDPAGRRARLYAGFVSRLGWLALPWVQRAGLGDVLVCLSRPSWAPGTHRRAAS